MNLRFNFFLCCNKMYPVYQTSTPPRIPPTFNASVISTDILQEEKMLTLSLGLNKVVGTVTLVAGTRTITNSLVSAGDFIFLTVATPSVATNGVAYCVPTVSNGSFVVSAMTNGVLVNTDTSTLRYMVVKPVA